MRIQGPNAPSVTTTSAARRRDGTGSGFSVTEQTTPQDAPQAAALRTIGGIDALLALQSENEPSPRRKAVKRGRTALDALDELKVALLAGTLDPATLRRLEAAADNLRDETGEASLDTVLAEIDLRVQVEIAKLKPRVKP